MTNSWYVNLGNMGNTDTPSFPLENFCSTDLSQALAKKTHNTYLKSLTVIINIVTYVLPIRVYFFFIRNHTYFILRYYRVPVEILGCVCRWLTCYRDNFSSIFRNVMLHNYFFVPHSLSVPDEITVLPLKQSGEQLWAILTYLTKYSKNS